MAISDVSVGVMMDNLNVLPRYNQCVVVILVVYHDAPNKIIHKKFRGGLNLEEKVRGLSREREEGGETETVTERCLMRGIQEPNNRKHHLFFSLA